MKVDGMLRDLVHPVWFMYIARCTDGSLYCGITKDVERRLAVHNSGLGAKYMRGRIPVVLVHSEGGLTRSDALKREAAVKKLSHAGKLALAGSSWQD
jgi:putative endonuclease